MGEPRCHGRCRDAGLAQSRDACSHRTRPPGAGERELHRGTRGNRGLSLKSTGKASSPQCNSVVTWRRAAVMHFRNRSMRELPCHPLRITARRVPVPGAAAVKNHSSLNFVHSTLNFCVSVSVEARGVPRLSAFAAKSRAGQAAHVRVPACEGTLAGMLAFVSIYVHTARQEVVAWHPRT